MKDPARSARREDWDHLVRRFCDFFQGAGTVETSDDAVVFRAASTGLELHRNGTSTSFMPLHELGARWDEVSFDDEAGEVQVRGDGTLYTYRLPPKLAAMKRAAGQAGFDSKASPRR